MDRHMRPGPGADRHRQSHWQGVAKIDKAAPGEDSHRGKIAGKIDRPGVGSRTDIIKPKQEKTEDQESPATRSEKAVIKPHQENQCPAQHSFTAAQALVRRDCSEFLFA